VTDGLVVVDKPAGMTSHDVVGRCRRIFAQKRVGHAGTLDPDATGVLLVGLGRATRLMQYMTGLGKAYTTDIVLGAATSTLDDSGETTGTWDMSAVTVADARRAAVALTGAIEQIPPMVSAVKVGGRRLHTLARAGIEVERSPRPVTVVAFDLEAAPDPDPQAGRVVLRAAIQCSSGTYIRVLADDLGRALGGGAHVRNLRRTSVGPWTAGDAVPLDEVGLGHVVPPAAMLPWFEATTVGEEGAAGVRVGRIFSTAELHVDGPGPWRVLGAAGDLLAVYEAHRSGLAKPRVVLDGAG
jgi:tRNA pseudouridine55 synthase